MTTLSDAPPTVPIGAVPVTRTRRRPAPLTIASVVLAAGLGALGVVPLASVIIGALSQGQEVLDALAKEDIVGLLTSTFIVVGVSTLFALIIGAVLAWVNERTDAGMGLVTEAMPLIPFMLPPIAGAIGWVLLMAPTAGFINGILRWFLGLFGAAPETGPLDIYSWYGLILVYTIYAVPYSFIMCTTGLRNMDPALEEQSRVSGASLPKTIFKVTLPAMMPSILGATLLMLISSFGIFSIPSVIGSGADIPILSVRIVRLLSFTYPPQTGAAIGLSMIVVLFVGLFWWLQTLTLRRGRFATIGGKGQRATKIRLGRGRPLVRAGVLVYIGITTVLPLLALLIVSLNGFWTLNIDWSSLSFDSFFQAIFNDRATRRALSNSLTYGAIGSIIGIVVVALASLYIVRSRTRTAQALDASIKFPSSLSHLVIAVGFVLVFSGPPFNLGGTAAILILAYIALYAPQASVTADTAVGQIGKELPEASRVSGAGDTKTVMRIFIPLMIPGLIAGWALLFVRMLGDLTASSMLAGTRNNVVGFRILEIYQNGSYAQLAALSFALTLISAFIVVTVLFISRRLARWTRQPSGGVR